MSIWTSNANCGRVMRPLLSLCAVIGVSGCLAAPNGGNGMAFRAASTVSQNISPSPKVLKRAVLLGGDVVVQPPHGYCVDGASLVDRARGGFALIGTCADLADKDLGQDWEHAIMTVSVATERDTAPLPSPEDIKTAFGPARVLAMRPDTTIPRIYLDGGDGAGPMGAGKDGVDPRHWRGVIRVNGHLIGIAVYGAKGGHAASPEGEDILIGLAQSIIAASPPTANLSNSPKVKTQVRPQPRTTNAPQPEKKPFSLKGLFQRPKT